MSNLEDISRKLDQLEGKVDTIQGKLSEKWVLPVSLAILAALLGLADFFIQRSFTNKDVGQNKEKEVIATYIADSKVQFYSQCLLKLNAIKDHFEALCRFRGAREQASEPLDNSLADFRKFMENQQVIEQSVIVPSKAYAEFVSEAAFDLVSDKPATSDEEVYLKKSLQLYREATQGLSSNIAQLKGS